MKKIVFMMLLTLASSLNAKEYMTFFMAGQSNMDGYGYVKDLPKSLNKEQDVMIFHGNGVFANQPLGGVGLWSKLRPGHGTGFSSDGKSNKYSDRFGSELTFAAELQKAFPNQNIAIIKYAVGGTGLHLKTGYDNWSPDFTDGDSQNQYDYALNTINNAYQNRDIDGDGVMDTLIPAGIVWMQGEADAHTSPQSANVYFANLKRLMTLLRAAFRKDDIPVLVGKITDSQMGEEDIMPYIDVVHAAQSLFVEQDVCAGYMTDIDNYQHNPKDPWHYKSQGYIDMGKDFANVFIKLKEKSNCN